MSILNIDDLVKRLSEVVPPSIKAAKADLEHNFRSILQSALNKLDLVTREEFDVQAKVLLRTRTKVENLEKRVAFLEVQLQEREDDACDRS